MVVGLKAIDFAKLSTMKPHAPEKLRWFKILKNKHNFFFRKYLIGIELLNNKFHGLSPSGGFALLWFDQAVPENSQRHLANQKAICILH